MKITEFWDQLTNVRDGTIIQVTDGPLYLTVSKADAIAGAVLKHLYNKAGDDDTLRKTQGVIISNLLDAMDRASKDLPRDSEGLFAAADLLDDSQVAGLLASWWWFVFLTCSKQYDPDFKADEQEWTELSTTANPKIHIIESKKEE